MSIIIPTNSAVGGGYDVANGVRFDDGSSSNFTDGSAPGGNRQKFTWSAWFKRSSVGATQILASSSYSGSDEGYLFLSGGGILGWQSNNGGDGNLSTAMLWRDMSAWYHVVFSVDTTQSTATNRIKLYVNGSQYTWDGNTTQPNVNQSLYFNVGGSYNSYIGRRAGGDYFDGYMSEIVFIDNAQLAADSFGEFDSDSGVWKPLESVADLTFGTSGYYLNFQNSSALGTDVSGVGNTFTANNLAAIDQTTDTCTNNFATWNPLDVVLGTNAPLENGNTTYKKTATGSTTSGSRMGTIGVSSGKWYWEFKSNNIINYITGIIRVNHAPSAGLQGWLANDAGAYGLYDGGGQKTVAGTVSADSNVADWGSTVAGIAIDLDNGKFYSHVNGTYMNSGDPTSGATGTGSLMNISLTNTYEPWVCNQDYNQANDIDYNFGNPAFAISSSNADGNGYGNFEFAVPSGYFALCTKNLAEYG